MVTSSVTRTRFRIAFWSHLVFVLGSGLFFCQHGLRSFDEYYAKEIEVWNATYGTYKRTDSNESCCNIWNWNSMMDYPFPFTTIHDAVRFRKFSYFTLKSVPNFPALLPSYF